MLIVMISCKEKKQLIQTPATSIQQPSNFSFLYNPGSTILHPDFYIYHNSDETSQLNFRLFFRELKFNMANPDGVNMAKVKLHYRLYRSYENLEIIDSASHVVDVIPTEGSAFFVGALNIPTQKKQKYVLEVSVQDMFRGSSGKSYLNVDKTTYYNGQNFKVYSVDDMTQLFYHDMFSKKNLSIQYNRMPEGSITVDLYINPPPIPNPPYIIDSIEHGPLTKSSSYELSFREMQNYQLGENGLYHFSVNPDSGTGLLVGYFGSKYPRISTVKQMIGPLKYITIEEEYLNILANNNKKIAIDNFWLKQSGSTDRAREQIRIYYSRALFANFYFTGICEGWRSDRGMIYMIFGPPEKITRLNTLEIWSYKKTRRSDNPEFHFIKVDSNLSDNVFSLIRDESYKKAWEQAIASWRRGQAYSFTE